MYITITPQKLTGNFRQSVADFVSYLEKENEELPSEKQEFFFNHNQEYIHPDTVISEIDKNTAKLKKKNQNFIQPLLVLQPTSCENLKVPQRILKNILKT